MTDQNRDQLHRFIFENLAIRGELVQMDKSWQAILARYDYPGNVREQLGQAMAAALLMSATIKFEGSLILQSQSSGPLTTLVAQATDQRTVRGLARWQKNDIPKGTLTEVFGEGQMVLTIDNRKSDRYQGIVSLDGDNLGDALETYFNRSEQLASRFWLMADGERTAGLFLQQMPSEEGHGGDWERVGMLAETVTREELLSLAPQTLLHRLFHEEEVRLFEPEPVAFRCSCSRERIENTLRTIGMSDVKGLLEEQGKVQVDCEFCNKQYRFDSVDVERVFAQEITLAAPTRSQ